MSSRKHARGFSMVEVLVATGILGIGVLAGVTLFQSGVGGVTESRNTSTGRTIAIQRLESLGTQGIDQLPACAGSVGCQADTSAYSTPLSDAGSYPCTQQVLEGPTEYRVDTAVRPHPDTARQAGAMLVTVSVCWSDNNLVHQTQLSRIFIPDL